MARRVFKLVVQIEGLLEVVLWLEDLCELGPVDLLDSAGVGCHELRLSGNLRSELLGKFIVFEALQQVLKLEDLIPQAVLGLTNIGSGEV